MKLLSKAILFFLLFTSYNVRSQLLINEIMSANASFQMDEDYYNFSDWLEIYNSSDTYITMSKYYLSDDLNNLKKWKLPNLSLKPGGYYVVYCDKKDNGIHTNFGLSASGEILYIADINENIIDTLRFGKQYPNISYGRNPDRPDQLLYCSTPTPGKENKITTATIISPKAKYSIDAGRLNSSAILTLTGNAIKYTTDGSEPEITSSDYSQPININSTKVIKTKTFQEGYLTGEPKANTYFLNEHEFTLPVVSLSFTPDYFYDDYLGIHVRGSNGIEGPCGDVANWYQNWERAVYFEYFNKNGIKQISQPIGVKVSGGCTRGRDQKSLSLYARSKYGDNDFDYTFFEEKPDIDRFKSLMLRNSGNDQDQTLLRDAFIQALVHNSMDIDYQAYQPVIVYFNCEYRGIMNIREKVDEDYFISNYALSSDSVDFVEGVLRADADNCYEAIRGSAEEYKDLISFITINDLSDNNNYDQVASQIDIREYVNYMVLQIYIGNRDWPGNNLKFWRQKNGSKWRWIVFDLDYGFGFRISDGGATFESLDHATADDGPSHPNPPWSTILFRKLLENEGFKKQFISTFITHMYTSFHPNWCNYVLDSLSSVIDFEIEYNQSKYGRTKSDWLQFLDVLKEYAVDRLGFMPGYVKSFFSLNSNEVTISISNPDINKGKVNVNHAAIQMYPCNIETYEDLPLYIKAKPAKGYQFKHWMNQDSTIYSQNIEIVSGTSFDISIEPIFEAIEEEDGMYLNEITCVTELFNDDFNENSGFIEIYNPTDEDIIMYSFFLSDDMDNLERYAIPDSTVIPANDFIVFYADGQSRQGSKHTSFRLSTNGESLYLTQKVGNTLHIRDQMEFDRLFEEYSYGKYEDGIGNWQFMTYMTPGAPNNPDEPVIGIDRPEVTAIFNVYPNPSDGHIFISANETDIYSDMYSFDIVDIGGKLLYPKIWLNNVHNEIDLSHLNNGIYFVRLFEGTYLVQTNKVIIYK